MRFPRGSGIAQKGAPAKALFPGCEYTCEGTSVTLQDPFGECFHGGEKTMNAKSTTKQKETGQG